MRSTHIFRSAICLLALFIFSAAAASLPKASAAVSGGEKSVRSKKLDADKKAAAPSGKQSGKKASGSVTSRKAKTNAAAKSGIATAASAKSAKSVKNAQEQKAQNSKPAGKKRRGAKAAASAEDKAIACVGYKGAVVFDATANRMLFSQQSEKKVPPASLTKILSMFVAEDAIKARRIPRETLATVSQKAAATGGSRMGLVKGERVSIDELLRGMAVSSGNDASIAVAEFIGGSEENFVRMMNAKARAIGMNASTFKNANGLPAPGQFTTAGDMLALARAYLAAYPLNLHKYHNQSDNIHRGRHTTNANPLLGNMPGANGLKTGYVRASGYNLIATAERNGRRLIGVVLGSPTSAVRAAVARNIMEEGFSASSGAGAQMTPPAPVARMAAPASSARQDKTKKKSGKLDRADSTHKRGASTSAVRSKPAAL